MVIHGLPRNGKTAQLVGRTRWTNCATAYPKLLPPRPQQSGRSRVQTVMLADRDCTPHCVVYQVPFYASDSGPAIELEPSIFQCLSTVIESLLSTKIQAAATPLSNWRLSPRLSELTRDGKKFEEESYSRPCPTSAASSFLVNFHERTNERPWQGHHLQLRRHGGLDP